MRRAVQRAVWRRFLPAAIPLVVMAASPEQAEIQIDNFAFSPPTVQVEKGTTVIWVNHDDIPHSVVLEAQKVHSPPMDTDGTFSYRFETEGTFTYICGLHPHMKGRVVVSD
jgi:plastocyanin